MLRRLQLLILLPVAFALQACNYGDVASAGSLAVSALPLFSQAKAAVSAPVGGMSKESYEETNALYVSTGKRLVAAVKGGRISPPSAADEPDTTRSADDFCKLAKAGLAQVSSPGGELKRLDCLANDAIADMENALERNDPVAFAAAKGRAKGHLSDMDRIISEAERGT